ncbi:CPPED1 [Cordylochernes scorpioides]|uniref:CPPED1 n=1 Tax=Cordylochernes scorpioides TaxID=51811 RepID=A0ABY6LRS4_9ARAC|nr:CPPED1 [Cordylochernes scorpioides]
MWLEAVLGLVAFVTALALGMDLELRVKANNRTLSVFDPARERLWQGPFTFLQAADTQFGMIENYIERNADPGWQQEIALTRKMVKAANAMSPRPRFLIICGDLVDAMPGTPKNEPQIRDFKKVLEGLDNQIPLVCVCGNHDIGNQPTVESIQHYNRHFGDDYFSFLCGGVKFIVLNSQFYENPSKPDFNQKCGQVVHLAEAHDTWLDSELADNNYRHLVIFQHIPWFLTRPDEPKQYFNIDFDLRHKMLSKFKQAVSETSITHNYYPLDQIPVKVDLELIG